MDLKTWQEQIRQRLARWGQEAKQRVPDTAYGFLSAMALLPVIAAFRENDLTPLLELGRLVAGMGGSLLANQVQAWKDRPDEALEAELARQAEQDEGMRAALDELLNRLDAVDLARQTLGADDRAWFETRLREEVARLGSGLTITVQGDRNVVVKGRAGAIITGDDVQYIERMVIQSAVFQTPPPPGQVDPKVLLWTYLSRVVEETGGLDLSGIDRRTATDPEAARLELAAVYTALDTQRAVEPETRGRRREAMPALGERERQSVLDFANEAKYAALLGDPGSGKTTFVNFLALCLAGETLGLEGVGLGRLGQEWTRGALLPVRVVLRQFAAQLPLTRPPDPGGRLWGHITGRLGQSLTDFAPLLKQSLLEEGGLLILDGLDEVPEAYHRRETVKQAVLDFKRMFPRVRILLTSRTYAYQQQAWRLPGFEEAALAPFNPEQINSFVDSWYAHMAQVRPNLSVDEARGRAERLKAAIEREAHLGDLAPRPLLLTLMASLHAWRGGNLPEDREQLYDESVELLLDLWERPKEVLDAEGQAVVQTESLAEWLRAPQRDVRMALEALAFRAHHAQPTTTGAADIQETDLAGALYTAAVRSNPDLKLDRVIAYIRDRAGLLTNRAEGVYSFPHRTFQEYLAARHLGETGFPTRLVSLARQDPERWREVLLLAGARQARTAPYAAWALAAKLCPGACDANQAQAASDADWWAPLLAGQMLAETGLHLRLDPVYDTDNQTTLKHIKDWLARLVGEGHLPAVDRAAAGRALGALGDPRPGVGVVVKDGRRLPDIAWSEVIPPGPFIMGSDPRQDEQARKEEQPQFTCRLIKQPYRVSRYPVTVAQYRLFIEAGGYANPAYWDAAVQAGAWKDGQVQVYSWRRDEPGQSNYVRVWADGPEDYGVPFILDNHPQVGVSWYEATAYCAWLSEGLGHAVRLPTEAEWERAARDVDGRLYPWPGAFDRERCNNAYLGIGSTTAVGLFPGGNAGCGAADIAGNVWEWLSTPWVESYQDYERKIDDKKTKIDSFVVRGGAFDVDEYDLRCAFRLRLDPDGRDYGRGFRLVVPGL